MAPIFPLTDGRASDWRTIESAQVQNDGRGIESTGGRTYGRTDGEEDGWKRSTVFITSYIDIRYLEFSICLLCCDLIMVQAALLVVGPLLAVLFFLRW